MDIHSFCIMHTTGLPVYNRHFTEAFKELDFSMITSLFSALLQFAKKVTDNTLDVLDMGKYRLIIRDYNDSFKFIIISDITTSTLLIEERINKIKNKIPSIVNLEDYSQSCCVIENSQLDTIIDSIMDYSFTYDGDKATKISEISRVLEGQISSGDCVAGAVLSLKGDVFYSSLPLEELHLFLKEVEIRTKSETGEIPTHSKFIYQTEKRLVLSQVIKMRGIDIPVYVVLLFDRSANLGIADYTLEEIADELKRK